MIITIDGPAGVGKSTAAKRLARELGLAYLDTGATYRAATLRAMRADIDLADVDALLAVVSEADIQLDPTDGGLIARLDGEEVSEAIRSPAVTNNVHFLANSPPVREILVSLQRQLGAGLGSFVAEGRDQGSVVFPHADMKFFLDADPAVRARRRHDELSAAGDTTSFDQVLADVELRDDRDRNRAVGPLVRPDDAIDVNTSEKTIEQVLAELLTCVEQHRCQ
jgi:CMP/dCMP kinase